MKVKSKKFTIGQLVENYDDQGDNGVTGLGGKLNIRPPYQREFVYSPKQQILVINSILRKLPLNVMYFVTEDGGATYELLDGQQRIMSICRYYKGVFSANKEKGDRGKKYDRLIEEDQKRFLKYKIRVYICEGNADEKIEWFERINIAGERLNDQEIRNAIYNGPWVNDAKAHFSRQGSNIDKATGHLVRGVKNRQDFLKTALAWVSDGHIDDYMAHHAGDENAKELIDHYTTVTKWAEWLFVGDEDDNKRKELQDQDWNKLWDKHHTKDLDPAKIQARVDELMEDKEVQKKSGIYDFVLSGNELKLNLRTFDDDMKRQKYEEQKGKCAETGQKAPIEDMEADHIIAWSKGGKTTLDNCQMVHRDVNRSKGSK